MDTIFDQKSRSENPAERLEAYCHFLELAKRQLAESQSRLSRDCKDQGLATRWARDRDYWQSSVDYWTDQIRATRFARAA